MCISYNGLDLSIILLTILRYILFQQCYIYTVVTVINTKLFFFLKMSRVPGYEQRLKALLFKGNFNEKITEMKEVRHEQFT